jgi:SAM-dependent methyltransferase
MPKASIITPAHERMNPYLLETYRSLQRQTLEEWEWIVLLNHGGMLPPEASADPRVRSVMVEPPADSGIGWLKAEAASHATGEFIFELDGDDLLDSMALEYAARAFDAGADFVYSDFAEFQDGTWKPVWYSTAYGWQNYAVVFEGHALVAMRAPEATAQNLRRIEWAPNHFRAWRRETYERIGGHNRELRVCDDHELVLRTYLDGAKIVHVPRCLYFYRVHAGQTTKRQNAEIQRTDEGVYLRYVLPLAEAWARRAGLRCVDLCGGINPYPRFDILDVYLENEAAPLATPEENLRGILPAVFRGDLNQKWPLPDNSVGVIRAFDAIEHLRDPVHTMNEAWRVLAPGGFLITHTPSTDGRGAFCDPTHVSFWNELSFRYYTQKQSARFVPAFRGRFHVAHLRTFFPDDWHAKNKLSYVRADLIAIKEGYHPMGATHWGEAPPRGESKAAPAP